MDLSNLTTEELEALNNGDISKISTQALESIVAQQNAKPPASLLDRFLSNAANVYSPELGTTNPEIAAAERQATAAATTALVRYGVPIAASLAAARLGPLAQSGVGGVSSALSAGAADWLEGKPFDAQSMAAEGVRGAVLQFPAGSFGAGALRETARIGTNVLSSMGFEMGARKVQGKNVWGDSALDLGFPMALSGTTSIFGSAANRVGKMAKKGEQVSKEFAGAAPLLSQIDEGYAKAEGRLLSGGGAWFINRLLDDLTIPLAKVIENQFPDDPEAYSRVMRAINPVASKVDELRSSADAAAREYKIAKSALDKAYAEGRTVSREFVTEVQGKLAAAEREKAFASEEVRRMLFGKSAPTAQDVAVATLQDDVARIKDAVTSEKKRIFDAAYESVGIQKDTKVGEISDLLEYVADSDLSTAEKNLTKTAVLDSLKEAGIEAEFTNEGGIVGNITNQSLVNMREILRKNLLKKGLEKANADAQAEKYYKTISNYADDYIRTNIGEDVANLRLDVNTRYAKISDALESKLGVDIEKVDPQAFVDRIIEEQGEGLTLKNLASYKNAIYQMAPQDKRIAALADSFEQKIHSLVFKGLVGKHLNAAVEGVSDFARINVDGLVSDLNALRNYGYPVNMLGVTPDNVRSLARLTRSSIGKKADVTYGEFQQFLKMLPEIGQDAAAAKTRAFSEFRKAYRASVLPIKQNIANLADVAKKAKLTELEKEAARKMAESDPIYQLVTNSEQMKSMLNRTYTVNSSFIDALFQQSPQEINGLLKALKDKGRPDLIDDIRHIATYTVMRDLLEKNPVGASVINDQAFNRLFNAAKIEDRERLAAFQTIVGPDGMKTLNDGILGQIKKIVNVKGTVYGYKSTPTAPKIRPFVGAADMQKGSSTGGQLKANYFGGLIDQYREYRYRVAHALYAEPVTSKMFAQIGYDINRIAEQPALAVAVRLAAEKDAQTQAQAQAQQQAQPQGLR